MKLARWLRIAVAPELFAVEPPGQGSHALEDCLCAALLRSAEMSPRACPDRPPWS